MRPLQTAALGLCLLIAGGCAGGPVGAGASATSGSTGSPAVASAQPVATDGLVDIGAGLLGVDGLSASVYATGLTHASAFAFDAAGLLWVATADYTDSGADGVYLVTGAGATPVQVIAGLHTPLGLLWYAGTLYVASKERVDAYGGFNGSSFSTVRTVVSLPAGVGEVNGLATSPDGRLVLGISAPCDHCTPTSEYSGSIVSYLPDGSDLRVDVTGIRAPVGLAYYPGTSDLFVTMNQRDDLGEMTPGDYLSVVKVGQDWGFPDCYGQGGSACAGVPVPTAVLDTHAAVSGVAIVTGGMGAAVGNSAVVAEWSTGVVEAVVLTSSGSTYAGTATRFLTGLQNPVAVALSPDGALLVGDWTSGTIYWIATT
jgi:glucose/arabinose dehydrogenase